MFINIKLLSKNQNSIKKFLNFLNSFLKKKRTNENILKKKYRYPNNIFFKLYYNKYNAYQYKNIYKIKKKKYKLKKNINGFLNYASKKEKQKFFTILKSPHVNKTAQEQIEYRLFSKQIHIFSFQIFKFLILIKKIQTKIFPDVKIYIKFILNNKKTNKKKLISLNPDNYKIFAKNNKKTILYLKLFDIYGELNFNYPFR